MRILVKVPGTLWASAAVSKLIGQALTDCTATIAWQEGGMRLILSTCILTARQ